MDEIRLKHFAFHQLMTRKRCPRDNNNPCIVNAKKSNCIECANRHFQGLADAEMEEMVNGG